MVVFSRSSELRALTICPLIYVLSPPPTSRHNILYHLLLVHYMSLQYYFNIYVGNQFGNTVFRNTIILVDTF